MLRNALTLALVLAGIAPAAAQTPDDASTTPDDSGDHVKVDPSGRIDLRFHNVDIFLALEMLSEQTQRNIVTHDGVSGNVNVILRGVTFDQALDTLLAAQNLTYKTVDGVIHVMKPPPPAVDVGTSLEMRLFRLNYVSATDAENFIKPLLSKDGKSSVTKEPEVGIAPSSTGAGGFNPANPDVLVVVDHADALERVDAALREIDQRPVQVLVEATIMRATLNEQNALGIDFNTLAGINFQTISAESRGIGSITLGPVPSADLRNTNIAARTDFNSLVPDGGFTFGIVKDNVAAFIRALEQVTDVSIMANPKLLTLNKQRGEVIVGRRDGYLTTTVTQTAAVQTVDFLETGTKLTFRPFVARDGYVRMEIHPEDSNGGLSAANLPFEETTEATSNVLLKDGNTILIGGLFRERTVASKSHVPVLGDMPGLKFLFGVNQDQTTREEVIILLTVNVLDDPTKVAAAFAELDDDLERLRVGTRRGLMGTGRELLAQARYHAAVEELRAGCLNKALADVRMALSLNPRLMDAVRLEERLTRERTWSADGSLIRTFVDDIMRSESGLGPLYGRPDIDALLRQRESQDEMKEAEPEKRGADDDTMPDEN